jgi:hypothetical protein
MRGARGTPIVMTVAHSILLGFPECPITVIGAAGHENRALLPDVPIVRAGAGPIAEDEW